MVVPTIPRRTPGYVQRLQQRPHLATGAGDAALKYAVVRSRDSVLHGRKWIRYAAVSYATVSRNVPQFVCNNCRLSNAMENIREAKMSQPRIFFMTSESLRNYCTENCRALHAINCTRNHGISWTATTAKTQRKRGERRQK